MGLRTVGTKHKVHTSILWLGPVACYQINLHMYSLTYSQTDPD
jgi:hypothetical protein